MTGPVTEPLHWSDVPELVRLEQRIYGADAWSEGAWWAELAARPRRAYTALRDDEGLLGYAGLDLGPDIADVMTITLAPRARGRGLGHVLMAWLVGTCAATSAESLMLEVRSDNAAARALYSAWGFREISTRRNYYRDADALILRRQIAATDRAQVGADAMEETG